MIKRLFHQYFELVFWSAALIALAATNPATPGQYNLCPLKMLGFTWCPGCGIGHAISWLLHGNIKKSWQSHWLGVPATLIILWRIVSLIRLRISPPNSSHLPTTSAN